ncbi:MAG: adenylosuccinate synthase [Oscillospiraceae bacterium]|jgi:adenylosuccinate synthase|nr:adenylosuccinate synthase [Oscillospiraceae bacterium]
MAISVLVGAQYGDEGKGKMIDYLSRDMDLVTRFQGGDNAGHTVINDYGVFKMHLIPCGIFTPGVACLIGTGTAVNPDVLIEEIEELERRGIDTSALYISEYAQLVLPYHVKLDGAMEGDGGGIGTTKRGIGQAYAYKYLRRNPRAGDLRDLAAFRHTIETAPELSGIAMEFPSDEQLARWQSKLAGRLVNPIEFVHGFIDGGKNLLFEGQLGVMKDIDLGIYPFVTSSHTTAGYAAVSGGFSPKKIDRIIGVAKAFSSAIGEGSFPTEMGEDEAAPLRGTGDNPDDEYGARTGRPRRLGWFDMEHLKFANRVNGFDEIALTKLDKLDSLAEIKLCTHYEPGTQTPVYKTFKGWLSDTSKCKTYAELPAAAKEYVEFIERSVGVPITYIGNGPARHDVIVKN